MAEESVVLSFHDCLLYSHDVELLGVGQWLNDSLIEFAFEYFTQVLFSHTTSKRLLFIPPGTSQFLKLVAPSESAVVLDPLNFNSQSVTFLCVNDNTDPSLAGGTHWSLLVYFRGSNRALHLDSMGSSNHADAVRLATTLSTYCGRQIKVVDINCPKQQNACDCGAYVIHFSRTIAEYVINGGRCEAKEIELAVFGVTPRQVADVRQQLRNWITELGGDDTAKAT